jgi:hypothetical protein
MVPVALGTEVSHENLPSVLFRVAGGTLAGATLAAASGAGDGWAYQHCQ